MDKRDFIAVDMSLFEKDYSDKLEKRIIELWNEKEYRKAAEEGREPHPKPVPEISYGSTSLEDLTKDANGGPRSHYDFGKCELPKEPKCTRAENVAILLEAFSLALANPIVHQNGHYTMSSYNAFPELKDVYDALDRAGIPNKYSLDNHHKWRSMRYGTVDKSAGDNACLAFKTSPHPIDRGEICLMGAILKQAVFRKAMRDSSSPDPEEKETGKIPYGENRPTYDFVGTGVSAGLRKSVEVIPGDGGTSTWKYYLDGNEVPYSKWKDRDWFECYGKRIHKTAIDANSKLSFRFVKDGRFGQIWDRGREIDVDDRKCDGLELRGEDLTELANDLMKIKGLHYDDLGFGCFPAMYSADGNDAPYEHAYKYVLNGETKSDERESRSVRTGSNKLISIKDYSSHVRANRDSNMDNKTGKFKTGDVDRTDTNDIPGTVTGHAFIGFPLRSITDNGHGGAPVDPMVVPGKLTISTHSYLTANTYLSETEFEAKKTSPESKYYAKTRKVTTITRTYERTYRGITVSADLFGYSNVAPGSKDFSESSVSDRMSWNDDCYAIYKIDVGPLFNDKKISLGTTASGKLPQYRTDPNIEVTVGADVDTYISSTGFCLADMDLDIRIPMEKE